MATTADRRVVTSKTYFRGFRVSGHITKLWKRQQIFIVRVAPRKTSRLSQETQN